MVVVAPGLIVMAVVYFMGAERSPFEPGVTLAIAIRRNFPSNRVPGYLLGQAVGGVLAALFLRSMFGTIGLVVHSAIGDVQRKTRACDDS